MAEPETVLASTDLSDPSIAALQQAAALAGRLGAKLVVTYVVEDRLPPLMGESQIEQILQQHERHAARALDDFLGEHLSGAGFEPVVRRGEPHEQIVALARERNAMMIVVGMHGHGFLAHALSGNTAERVLHHAPCPVLVVPHV